jgi:hypothetical protein
VSFGAGAAFPWWIDPDGTDIPGPSPGANVYDQVTDNPIPGRWHVRVQRATGIVEFKDYYAQSMNDAITQQQADLQPGDVIEWTCWEPNVYGVWGNGFGMNAVRMP